MRPLLDIVRHEKLDRLSALKVDVEGFADRVLAPFLGEAPDSLLPETIIAELIWREHGAEDWRQTAARRGYRERARTPTGNVILILRSLRRGQGPPRLPALLEQEWVG